MSKNKTFTGPLAEHIQRFLNEKRSLGYKYEEQERVLYVLDQMSKQFDCSNGLPKNLCLAFIERDPNWRQKTQEQRVTLIRTFAEYLIRHEISSRIFLHIRRSRTFLMLQIQSVRILLIRIFFIQRFCAFSMDAAFASQKHSGCG